MRETGAQDRKLFLAFLLPLQLLLAPLSFRVAYGKACRSPGAARSSHRPSGTCSAPLLSSTETRFALVRHILSLAVLVTQETGRQRPPYPQLFSGLYVLAIVHNEPGGREGVCSCLPSGRSGEE